MDGLLSAAFGILQMTYKVSNSYIKVLVKGDESKIFPASFRVVEYFCNKKKVRSPLPLLHSSICAGLLSCPEICRSFSHGLLFISAQKLLGAVRMHIMVLVKETETGQGHESCTI